MFGSFARKGFGFEGTSLAGRKNSRWRYYTCSLRLSLHLSVVAHDPRQHGNILRRKANKYTKKNARQTNIKKIVANTNEKRYPNDLATKFHRVTYKRARAHLENPSH